MVFRETEGWAAKLGTVVGEVTAVGRVGTATVMARVEHGGGYRHLSRSEEARTERTMAEGVKSTWYGSMSLICFLDLEQA